MNPDNDEINRAYQRIKDLRILEIIDLAEQLELISQVYKHTTQAPYQARHNVSQQ